MSSSMYALKQKIYKLMVRDYNFENYYYILFENISLCKFTVLHLFTHVIQAVLLENVIGYVEVNGSSRKRHPLVGVIYHF